MQSTALSFRPTEEPSSPPAGTARSESGTRLSGGSKPFLSIHMAWAISSWRPTRRFWPLANYLPFLSGSWPQKNSDSPYENLTDKEEPVAWHLSTRARLLYQEE